MKSKTPMDSTELTVLANEINELHRQAEETAGQAIDYARQAGEKLIEAKAGCKHGTWRKWLEDNFAGTKSTAHRYMTVAKRWDEVSEMSHGAGHLSLNKAVALLAETKGQKKTCDRSPSKSVRVPVKVLEGIDKKLSEFHDLLDRPHYTVSHASLRDTLDDILGLFNSISKGSKACGTK